MSINYEIWLSWDAEKEKIKLPVLPEAIQISNAANNNKMSIVGLGEIVVLTSQSSMQVSFSSFFPAHEFYGSKQGVSIHDGKSYFIDPSIAVRRIKKWQGSKTPIHFISTGNDIDMYASIENFNYSESGGDVGTYNYSITLKEYREVTTRQVDINEINKKATVKKSNARVDNSVTPNTYTVVVDDCPWLVAQKMYGDGNRWPEIMKANDEMLSAYEAKVGLSSPGGGSHWLFAGQVLTIP